MLSTLYHSSSVAAVRTHAHAHVHVRGCATDESEAFKRVPVVDLGRPRSEVAEELAWACRHVGFVYIANHGVAQDLIDTTFEYGRRLFALDRAAKAQASNKQPGTGGVRGHFYLSEEVLNEEDRMENYRGDLKEGFDVGRALDKDTPEYGSWMAGANVWPDADMLPGFREHMEAYYEELQGLGRQLVGHLAESLGLPSAHFEALLTRPMSTLRLLHYPPQRENFDTQVGCGAHTDYGLCTILAQDGPGLQVRNSRGEWVAAPPLPGTFVINLGDMMNRWTNGVYASTVHRVINSGDRDRYSVPFFFNPNYDATVSCLPTCLRPGQQPKYAPATCGDILRVRYSGTFDHIN